MKLSAFIAALLITSSASPARPPAPSYDCSEERTVQEPIYQAFGADEFHAHFYAQLGPGVSLMAYAHVYTEEERQAFIANGMLGHGFSASFGFTLQYPRTRRGHAEIRSGNIVLPRLPLRRVRDGGSSVTLSAPQFAQLLGDDAELTIAFYDRQGQILTRYSVSSALVRAALAELPPMLRRVGEKQADPPNRCDRVLTVFG